MAAPTYVVVTPVRDEEKHIRFTLESMIAQTVRPAEWVIVDDGSTDATGEILDEYASKFSWIRVVHRSNRGYRKSGGGVMEAFQDGYKSISRTDWNFIVKLDGDLSFSPGYFQTCFNHFQQNAELGIAGGTICHAVGNELRPESQPIFHVRGATKIYRRECWFAIGGLWPAPGWDTIDEVKANMLGWKTRSLPELHLLHHRITGGEDGLFRDRVKHGVVCYVSGYHPLFVLASCAKRLFQQPYVTGSIGVLYGFIKARFTKVNRVQDRSYLSYIRAQQLRCLCGMPTIWK